MDHETAPAHNVLPEPRSITSNGDARLQPWKAAIDEMKAENSGDKQDDTFQATPGYSCDSLAG